MAGEGNLVMGTGSFGIVLTLITLLVGLVWFFVKAFKEATAQYLRSLEIINQQCMAKATEHTVLMGKMLQSMEAHEERSASRYKLMAEGRS